MNFVEESILVRPRIGLLNRYAQRTKQVAITSINPVFSGQEPTKPEAFRINIEGPAQYLNRFNQMLERANLKIQA